MKQLYNILMPLHKSNLGSVAKLNSLCIVILNWRFRLGTLQAAGFPDDARPQQRQEADGREYSAKAVSKAAVPLVSSNNSGSAAVALLAMVEVVESWQCE